jgi:hypothetical protein
MKRREFMSLVAGGTVIAWPLAARAQQATPLVGFLSGRSSADSVQEVKGFHGGLAESRDGNRD